MNTLHLEIITPDRIAYTDDVDMVVVPSTMGTIGILPRHVPLFAQLTEGELKIRKGSEEFFLAIGGGFLEVTKAKVSILVTRAIHARELNEQEILKAKKEAEEALTRKPSGKELIAVQTLYRQSLVDLRLLRRRKTSVH